MIRNHSKAITLIKLYFESIRQTQINITNQTPTKQSKFDWTLNRLDIKSSKCKRCNKTGKWARQRIVRGAEKVVSVSLHPACPGSVSERQQEQAPKHCQRLSSPSA
ncbi:hypothetical protein GOODEAATRI_019341 [Goodea atripinnis]|uniref:Uncharacterized protein n=1 Tax=Goodea atripinnis TaxID=208336 RepID=A0ABV0P675_9TELE